MVFIKLFILLLVFGSSLSIGILISKKYSNRVIELKDMKNALNMFETKIRYTYESIPDIFKEIASKMQNNIGDIFIKSAEKMQSIPAGDAWVTCVSEIETNFTIEDKRVLKGLGRLLGKTDIEGQISEIELVNNFLNTQIQEAEIEKNKNEKLYKTLGGVIGLTLVIILIWNWNMP